MLYVKKKLSPLKKGGTVNPLTVPGLDKKDFKITFLNVEKVELVRMYDNVSEPTSPLKKNIFMTASLNSKKE